MSSTGNCNGDSKIPDHINRTDLRMLREWMEKTPHLPTISEHQLATFLHSCFGSMEQAKKTIESYYTIRTLSPEIFHNKKYEEAKKALEVIYAVHLPRELKDGCHIIMLGFVNPDPSKFDLIASLRTALSVVDIFIVENAFVKGFYLLFDAKGFVLSHLTKVSTCLLQVKRAIDYVQDGLPQRLKGIHVMNAMPIIQQLLALIKPFMKKELFELIHIHTDKETDVVYKTVPQEYFPEEYGGKLPTKTHLLDSELKNLRDYGEWFEKDDEFGRTNESKRVGKSKYSNDSFGTEGSFKKLSLD